MAETIKDLLVILIGSSLVSNVVLSQFLGLCPFLGVSKKVDTAVGMGGAVVFVITLASAVAAAIYKFILVPLDITYLQTIVFILVIAALVQFVEMFLKKYVQGLYQALGVYLPLITTNCAVLGIALTNVQKNYGILYSIVSGFATAAGFLISITILAGIREKMEYNDIPGVIQRNAYRYDHSRIDGYCILWILRIVIGGVEYEYNSDHNGSCCCGRTRSALRSVSWCGGDLVQGRSR